MENILEYSEISWNILFQKLQPGVSHSQERQSMIVSCTRSCGIPCRSILYLYNHDCSVASNRRKVTPFRLRKCRFIGLQVLSTPFVWHPVIGSTKLLNQNIFPWNTCILMVLLMYHDNVPVTFTLQTSVPWPGVTYDLYPRHTPILYQRYHRGSWPIWDPGSHQYFLWGVPNSQNLMKTIHWSPTFKCITNVKGRFATILPVLFLRGDRTKDSSICTSPDNR